MKNSLPPAVRHLCARYRTQGGVTRQNSHEFHDAQSLAARVLLSKSEVLEQVSNGNILALSGPMNGKFLFSSTALDRTRDKVINFIANEIVDEMEARGADEDRILFALSRAFQKQHELSRRADNVISFARTPQDDDDDNFYGDAKKAAGVAAAAGAGYLGYRYLKNRGNGGNTLPDGSPRPQLPPGPSGDSQGGRHPGPPGSGGASISAPITTASSTTRKTVGNSVVDPLADAVASGRRKIAQRGSAIWRAIRSVPLE